ncbi:MAG: tRNA pseudouridine(38-40) synthase TruA [Flavobacteriales bacterium]
MRYFIELAYDGTHYHGWQTQPNAISVQETTEKCLSVLLSSTIKITGAGRTDSGVHAKQMFAHFDWEKPLTEDFTVRMNNFLPKDIVIKAIFPVKEEAHARFDALSRKYNYYISLKKNPFNYHSSWQFSKINLTLNLMNQAAQILQEYTDFTSFSKLHTDVKTNDCKIFKAEWTFVEKDLICFEIIADRFLRNMVRAIVGTLVEVGKNKLSLDEFRAIIKSKNRNNAGVSAPAKGLFLVKINYPDTIK